MRLFMFVTPFFRLIFDVVLLVQVKTAMNDAVQEQSRSPPSHFATLLKTDEESIGLVWSLKMTRTYFFNLHLFLSSVAVRWRFDVFTV